MNFEKMWHALNSHIETVKTKAYIEGLDEDYEQYLHFSEVIQEIENDEIARIRKENEG
ncbi:hypothetical protein [Macrococcoides caseolyticum]|uniref:hypothetical protein n=1 Tax=Macrococcoides caseolyticum TaxID=69966 RepID=UPI001642AB9B|nr:hypothetical protein [Macrococcus caseolyticus]